MMRRLHNESGTCQLEALSPRLGDPLVAA